MMGSQLPMVKCGACGSAAESGNTVQFCGVPVCKGCHGSLDLASMTSVGANPVILGLTGKDGRDAAEGLSYLATRQSKAEGWRLLSNTHGMTMALKDHTSRELLRGSLILVGTNIIGSGTGPEGQPMDTKTLTLSLVLGEVLCLSMMRRTSNELGLTSSGRLDDVLVNARFRAQLSDVLLGLRPLAIPGHENELASAVWTLLG